MGLDLAWHAADGLGACLHPERWSNHSVGCAAAPAEVIFRWPEAAAGPNATSRNGAAKQPFGLSRAFQIGPASLIFLVGPAVLQSICRFKWLRWLTRTWCVLKWLSVFPFMANRDALSRGWQCWGAAMDAP